MSSEGEGNSPPSPPEGGGAGEGGEAGAAAAAAGGGVPPLPPSLLGSGAPLAAALGELVAGAGEEEADMGRLQVFVLEVFLTNIFILCSSSGDAGGSRIPSSPGWSAWTKDAPPDSQQVMSRSQCDLSYNNNIEEESLAKLTPILICSL